MTRDEAKELDARVWAVINKAHDFARTNLVDVRLELLGAERQLRGFVEALIAKAETK